MVAEKELKVAAPRTETTPKAPVRWSIEPSERDVRRFIPPAGLKEYWYPAIEARKVGKKPVGMKICDEQVVFFPGKEKGEVNALANVCPHRGGSLMHGDCHYPGTISCPYHGWTFDGDGNVLAVLPEGPDSQVPGKIQHRSYPTQTLRGMVWVWMGQDEPAPIEEDLPPEFFTDKGQILYAYEVWPINWRAAVENAGGAHVPYVHRDAALVLLNPMALTGTRNAKTNIINNRTATFGVRRGQTPPSSANGSNGSNGSNGTEMSKSTAANAGTSQRPTQLQAEYPGLGKWPKHMYRNWWKWAFKWAGKRRYSKPPTDTSEEWGGMIHHLPSFVRLDYHTHSYSRINIPIDAENTRQIYIHYTRHSNWFAKFREKIIFHTWHRWAMYSDFSVQDFRAAGPQRYDTREYLSSTDAHLVIWRRLLLKARGLGTIDTDEKAATESETFSHARQIDVGVTPEKW